MLSFENDNRTQDECRKRKRSSDWASVQHDHIPWTAARCNRLLRTLTSRLNVLKKLAHEHKPTAASDREHAKRCSKSNGTTDPAWVPGLDHKVKSKTYARRLPQRPVPMFKSEKTTQPGLQSVSTPLLRRVIRASVPVQGSVNQDTPEHRTSKVVQHRTRQLPIKPTNSAQEAERGLTNAWTAFLSTTNDQPKSRHGSRSLSSLCLAQMPAYMQLEAEDASQAEHSDLYVHLECLHGGTNSGWSGLRELVRAHGTDLLRTAISEGSISLLIAESLLQICNEGLAVREAEQLAQAMIDNRRCAVPKHLQILDNITRHSGSSMPAMRTLSLVKSIDPKTFMSYTDHKIFWHSLMQGVTSQDHSAYAVLLQDVLDALSTQDVSSELPDSISVERIASWNDVALSLGALTIVAAGSDDDVDGRSTLYEAVRSVAVDSIIAHCRDRSDHDSPLRLALTAPFLLAFTLMRPSPPDNNTSMLCYQILQRAAIVALQTVDTTKSEVTKSNMAEIMASRVRSLEARLSMNVSSEMVGRLLRQDTASGGTVIRDFTLALATSRMVDMPSSQSMCGSMDATCLKDQPSNTALIHIAAEDQSFRWDEGICEWIAATPMRKTLQQTSAAATPASPLQSLAVRTPKSQTSPVVVYEDSPDVLAPTPLVRVQQTKLGFGVKKLRLSEGDVNAVKTKKVRFRIEYQPKKRHSADSKLAAYRGGQENDLNDCSDDELAC